MAMFRRPRTYTNEPSAAPAIQMKPVAGISNCSLSVLYTDAEEDDGHVVCRHCGTFLMTCGQFRRFVEARAALSEVHNSGC
jgi:hypothetical protein